MQFFRGHKEWTELTGKGVLDIPATFVPVITVVFFSAAYVKEQLNYLKIISQKIL
jgi:hypothetical protein